MDEHLPEMVTLCIHPFHDEKCDPTVFDFLVLDKSWSTVITRRLLEETTDLFKKK